jgi:hypothetical protein
MIREWRMANIAEGSGRGLILSRYPGICLEGPRKITKTLSKDSRSHGRDLNPGPTEYETTVLTNLPRRSIQITLYFSKIICSTSKYRQNSNGTGIAQAVKWTDTHRRTGFRFPAGLGKFLSLYQYADELCGPSSIVYNGHYLNMGQS